MRNSKRKLYIYVLLYITFSLLSVFCANSDIDDKKPITAEEELYQKCKSSYNAKDYNTSEQNINEFIKMYPKSAYIPEILFMQAFIQPDANTAINIYKDIIAKYPNTSWSAKAHYQIGQCYYLEGKYNDAAEHYRELVIRYSDDELYWQARYWRSKSLLAKGDYDGAIQALNSLKESGNKDIDMDAVLLSLGECYSSKKEYEIAEIPFRLLIEGSPNSKWVPSASFLLANCLQNQGRISEAKELYQKITINYPQSMEAKQAKKILDSPILVQNESPKVEKPISSPQLESLFLKESKANNQTKTVTQIQKTDQQPPPFKIEWKKDEETKPVVKTEAKPKKPEPYFSVQVGAYSQMSSAEIMAESLRKKNYDIEIVSSKSSGKSLYKVRVGKFSNRDEAYRMSQKLVREEKIDKPMIVSSE